MQKNDAFRQTSSARYVFCVCCTVNFFTFYPTRVDFDCHYHAIVCQRRLNTRTKNVQFGRSFEDRRFFHVLFLKSIFDRCNTDCTNGQGKIFVYLYYFLQTQGELLMLFVETRNGRRAQILRLEICALQSGVPLFVKEYGTSWQRATDGGGSSGAASGSSSTSSTTQAVANGGVSKLVLTFHQLRREVGATCKNVSFLFVCLNVSFIDTARLI